MGDLTQGGPRCLQIGTPVEMYASISFTSPAAEQPKKVNTKFRPAKLRNNVHFRDTQVMSLQLQVILQQWRWYILNCFWVRQSRCVNINLKCGEKLWFDFTGWCVAVTEFRYDGQVVRSWRDSVARQASHSWTPLCFLWECDSVVGNAVRTRGETLRMTACVLSWTLVDSAAARVWLLLWLDQIKRSQKEQLGVRENAQQESPGGFKTGYLSFNFTNWMLNLYPCSCVYDLLSITENINCFINKSLTTFLKNMCYKHYRKKGLRTIKWPTFLL